MLITKLWQGINRAGINTAILDNQILVMLHSVLVDTVNSHIVSLDKEIQLLLATWFLQGLCTESEHTQTYVLITAVHQLHMTFKPSTCGLRLRKEK